MNVKIHPSWQQALAPVWAGPEFAALAERVRAAYASGQVFPPAGRIFAAFDAVPFSDVRVVILGQDPYHDLGQATGLAFSVPPGVAPPPSLRNILQEVSDDTGAPAPPNGDLSRWAGQGVLLLNTTLTVEAHRPASHAGWGWEAVTDAAIRALSQGRRGLVFMLWGAHARRKGALIDRGRHLVLEAPHPSPLSAHRGFLGCRHFSQANQYLTAHNQSPIQW